MAEELPVMLRGFMRKSLELAEAQVVPLAEMRDMLRIEMQKRTDLPPSLRRQAEDWCSWVDDFELWHAANHDRLKQTVDGAIRDMTRLATHDGDPV